MFTSGSNTVGTHVAPAILYVPKGLRVENGALRRSRELRKETELPDGTKKKLPEGGTWTMPTTVSGYDPSSNACALDEFMQIAKAEGNEIRQFAQQWGVLNLCEHERPYTHSWRLLTRSSGRSACIPSLAEPLRIWRKLARKAADTLAAAIRLQNDEPASEEELSEARGLPSWALKLNSDVRAPEGYEMERKHERADHILRVLEEWLSWSSLRLLPRYNGAVFGLEFEHRNLFDLLTAQLIMAVAKAATLGLCAHCGRPFPLERRRKPGQRTFCPDASCQKGASRFWSRDYRARGKSTS